jgi:hypothetical protein
MSKSRKRSQDKKYRKKVKKQNKANKDKRRKAKVNKNEQIYINS